MNSRIKQLQELATDECGLNPSRFAELIVKDCMAIARNWEDQLEKYKMSSESDAVGIATYRIARQFGIEE